MAEALLHPIILAKRQNPRSKNRLVFAWKGQLVLLGLGVRIAVSVGRLIAQMTMRQRRLSAASR
jgi:hypothetical protein